MAIPRTVIVKDTKYKITCTYPFSGDGHTANGWCFFDDKIIYINPDLDNEDRQTVLFHEITHAIFHEYKIKPRKDFSPYYEKTVSALEEAKMQVARDNQNVWGYIFEGVNNE